MALYRYIDLAMHLVDRHLPADTVFTAHGVGKPAQPLEITLESAAIGHLRLRAICNSRPELHKDSFDYFQHFEVVSTDMTGFEPERGFEVAETIGICLQHTEIAGDMLAVESGPATTVYRWGKEDDDDAFPENDSEHFLTVVPELAETA